MSTHIGVSYLFPASIALEDVNEALSEMLESSLEGEARKHGVTLGDRRIRTHTYVRREENPDHGFTAVPQEQATYIHILYEGEVA